MYYGFNDITFTDNHDEVTTPLRTMNVHDRVFQRHPSQSHNDHIVRRKLNPKYDNNSHSLSGSTQDQFHSDILNSSTKIFNNFTKGVNKRFFF